MGEIRSISAAKSGVMRQLLQAFSPQQVQEDCTLYKIADGECGQSTLDCKYSKAAVAFAGLKAGNCSAQGYTVSDGTQTLNVPVIGKVMVEKFKKADLEGAARLLLATFDGAAATTYPWQAVNDPVMGGQSESNLTVDGKRHVAVWQGEVRI